MQNNHWLRFVALQIILFALSSEVYAQQHPAGVVTALQGKASLTRPAAPVPVALRFKDGVLVRDTIDTQEKSLVRVLFGGKSTVTLRELSRLEVREEILPTGATRSTMELSSGAILVNVAKQLMQPGDEIVIRTPSAVAAVRGTVVFFQYVQAVGQIGHTVMTVISGLVDALGHQIGPNTQAIIAGTDIKISAITQQQANQILSQSAIGGKLSSENSQTQTATAVVVADVLVTLAGGQPPAPPVSSPSPPSPPPPPTTIPPPVFPLAPPATLVVANDSLSTGNGISLFQLPSGQTAVQNQPLLIATNANISIGGNGFNNSGSFTSTSPDALFQLTDSTVSVGTDLVKMNGGSLNTGGGLLKVSGGSLTFGATSLLNLSGGANVTVAGSLLDLTNVNLNLGADPLVRNTGGSTLTNTAGPVIKITGGSLTAGMLGLGDSTETYNFTGSLLDLTNTTVTLTRLGTDIPNLDVNNAHFTLVANEPFIKMTSSTLTLTDEKHLIDFGQDTGSPVTQTGVALIATGTALNPSEIIIPGSLFALKNVNLIDTIPQIQLTHTTVTQTGLNSLIEVFSGLTPEPATIGGSLIEATDSTITSDSDLLNIQGGGQLVMNSANPVAVFHGGSYTFGADTGSSNSPNSLFYLQGNSTDAITGLGTDQPIKGNGSDPFGTLLKATGGATIEVKAGPGDSLGPDVHAGNAILIDTALLEAALPMIHLVGTGTSDFTTATTLTTAGDTMNISKSNVVSLGPVISLDNGIIHVTNGALITLTSGSNMNVTGDLLSLTNHSKINVVNGPLILVTGTSGTGTASFLNVSGALVNFGGSGGNQIIVNNSITPTATLSGIAVNTATGGTITIGPHPITNPLLGSISGTGSLIQATNGGKVTIVAP